MWVLLVDDDLATVTTIRDAINWQHYGFDHAYTAYNVAGAIREIESREPPQLIVCDIEMPMGTGLDLLKWVRSHKIEAEFIFLTNYEKFSYASEALEYRAGSYIVKPFNPERMNAAIEKAMINIRQRDYLHKYSTYGEYWLRSKDELRSAFWRGLLFFRFPNEEIGSQLQNRNLDIPDKPYTLILVRLPRFSTEDLNNQHTEWDQPSYQFAVKRLACEAILDEFSLGNIVDYSDAGYDYLALISVRPCEELEKRCKLFGEICHENIPIFRGGPVICISVPVKLSELGKKRIQLEQLLQDQLDSNKILLEGTAVQSMDTSYQPLDADLLMQYFERQQKIDVLNYIRSWLGKVGREGSIDRQSLRLLHQDFLQLLYAYLQKHEIQAHQLYMDPVSRQLQETAEHSPFDMLKWVSYVITRAFSCVEEIGQTETVVFQAMAWIRAHFRENISRDDVAASVFVTSSYLSRIFHQETGVKITDFLTRCRIEEAKMLLRTTEHTVSDIATESGFDSFSYFSTVFKKVTGLTPVQYRRENLA